MGRSIPTIKVSQPKKERKSKRMFLMRKVIVRSPAQEIIPDINKTTQAILSFLFIMKSERNIMTIPFEIKSAPIKRLDRKNKKAISGLYLEKNPQSWSISAKFFFMLKS